MRSESRPLQCETAPKGPFPFGPDARTVGQSNLYIRERWVGVSDKDRQRLSNALTRLVRTVNPARHGGGN